jgi:hypothetical protein
MLSDALAKSAHNNDFPGMIPSLAACERAQLYQEFPLLARLLRVCAHEYRHHQQSMKMRSPKIWSVRDAGYTSAP